MKPAHTAVRLIILSGCVTALAGCSLFSRNVAQDDFANLVDCRYVVDQVTGGIKQNNGIQVITSTSECLPGTVTADVQAALSGQPVASTVIPAQNPFVNYTPPPAIAQARVRPVVVPTVAAPLATLSTDVAFGFNSAALNPGIYPRLNQIAANLKARTGQVFTVEGHTDSVGAEPYNQTLSENRARAVQQYLIRQGVESGRIIITGAGEMRPKAPNDNSAGRAINRRVDIYAR